MPTLTEADKRLILSAVGMPEAANRIIELLELSGTGNVSGPASATDNALVRFDGATGALIQNSPVILSDAGALSGITSLGMSGSLAVGDGTVAAPAYSFASDLNLGLYRVAADTLGFSANGVNVGSYSSAGAWTIGAASGALTHIVRGSEVLGVTPIATDDFLMYRSVTAGSLSFSGGTGLASHGAIRLYGSANGSKPNTLELLTGGVIRLSIPSAGNTQITGSLLVDNDNAAISYITAPTATPLLIKSVKAASNGLRIYNNTATDVASIVNGFNASLELGTNNTVHSVLDSSGKAIFSAINTTPPVQSLFTIGSGVAQTILSGNSTQNGLRVQLVANSAATAYNIGQLITVASENAAFATGFASALYENALSKGAANTITRYAGARFTPTTAATNNASISDNEAYIGNYFIHQSGTVPSSLAGQVRVGSLGVGNRVAATTLGNVTGSVEVFDTAGVSLGFMPLYDAIT